MKRRLLEIACFLTSCLMASAHAQIVAEENSSVIFYLPLDGDTDAEIGRHPAAAIQQGEPTYQTGKRNTALLVGDGQPHLTFDAANLPAREGSLEFWFKPLNWNGLDTSTFHVFVETDPDDQGHFFLVYKYYNAQNAGFIWEDGGSIFQRHISGWKDWVHFAVTWSPTGNRMYFNGIASAVTTPKNPPQRYVGKMHIGDRPWHFPRNEQSLLDEVYIYERALEPEEIAWARQNAETRLRGQDVPAGLVPSKVHAKIFPLQQRILPEITYQSTRARAHTSATAELIGPQSLGPVSLAKNQGVLTFDHLPVGNYTLRVKFMDSGGAVLEQAEDTFFRPDDSWLGNTIGIPETPPSPWTPLDAKAQSVSCWGRTYQLGLSGLPQAIESNGEALLAAPIEFVASSPWTYHPPQLVRHSPTSATYQGRWTSQLGELQWEATAEYDGMLRYDLTLHPAPGAECDLLELRFPLRTECATLANCLTDHGAVLGHTPRDYQSSGARQWWLGNERLGLTAFRPSDQAWDRLDRPDGFRIETSPGHTTVVWSFLRSRQTLPSPWSFTFGLTATPVRETAGLRGRPSRVLPMNQWLMPQPRVYQPSGVEDMMANEGVREEISSPHILLWGGGEWRTYAPDWGRPQAYREGHAKLRAKGLSVMTYMMPCEAPQSLPEWRYWQTQWAMGEPHGWTDETWDRTTCVSSWVDYMVAFRMKMLHQYKFGGYYIDNNSARSGRNPQAGFGYEREGTIIPTYNYFGLRELFKRLYTAVKEYGRDEDHPTMVMGHVSSELPVAFLGFLDTRLDGEQFLAPIQQEGKAYHDLIPLDHWRATNLSRNLGNRAVFLPEFGPADSDTPEKTRQLLGLLMLHDMVGIYFSDNHQANTAAVASMWRIQDQFNVENAELIPYWNNADSIGGQNATLKATGYRQRNGGALIVIANLTSDPTTSNLAIKWKRFKSPGPLRVTDAETGLPVPLPTAHLQLKLPANNHRLILVD